jgi:hypothetical protein
MECFPHKQSIDDMGEYQMMVDEPKFTNPTPMYSNTSLDMKPEAAPMRKSSFFDSFMRQAG